MLNNVLSKGNIANALNFLNVANYLEMHELMLLYNNFVQRSLINTMANKYTYYKMKRIIIINLFHLLLLLELLLFC